MRCKRRALWKEYRKAYEEMFETTPDQNAPWFIIRRMINGLQELLLQYYLNTWKT